MMKGKKYLALALAVCLLAAALAGCQQKEEIPEGAYQIFHLQQSGMELAVDYYMAQSSDSQEIVSELWEQFTTVPEGEEKISAFSQNITLLGTSLQDQILYFDFSKEYKELEKDREVLLRAALVLTFVQVPGVESVTVNVEGQPLTDSNSNPIGPQTNANFVDVFGKGLNSATITTLTLYFSNETGDKLVPEIREVALESSYSVEQYVVSLLIEGPQEEGHKATLPSNLNVLNVSVKDNICYVTFDSAFEASALADVNNYIPVYSVVNSLAELTGVRKVQISVDGSSSSKFKDSIPLNEPLDRNLDYVEAQ